MSDPTRESVIAAAEQAMAAEEPAAEPAPVPTPQPEPTEEKISHIVRAKKEAQRIRAEAQKEREQLTKEREQIAALQRKVKEDPYAAVKELGLDVKALNQMILNDGTPEGELAKVRREIEQERQARLQLQQSLTQREAKVAEEAFVAVASKHPTLSALYGDDPKELIARAYQVQNAYYQKTGQVPTREDIAQYLEEVESSRYAKLMKKQPPSISKTLNPRHASAVSGPTKRFEEMTPSEQRRHLIHVAQEAEKNYKAT